VPTIAKCLAFPIVAININWIMPLCMRHLGVCHAKKVKQWLTGKEEQIEIFYLPPYSPELNPDEHLNCDLKAGVQSGNPARSKEQLKRKATRHIRMLQRESGRVKRYFEHRQIKYAA